MIIFQKKIVKPKIITKIKKQAEQNAIFKVKSLLNIILWCLINNKQKIFVNVFSKKLFNYNFHLSKL